MDSSPTSGPSLRHANKSKRWVVTRYFGQFNKSRQDRWVFGDRDSGAYLLKFSWTSIVRHQLVPGGGVPGRPALVVYWATTAKAQLTAVGWRQPASADSPARPLPSCDGFCCSTRQRTTSPTEWEQWLTVTRKAIRRQASHR